MQWHETDKPMESSSRMAELVDAIAHRCFGGTLPNLPETIALAVVEACLLDESAENLTHFMNSRIPAIERAMAVQGTRTRRLVELKEEIASLHGKICRSRNDEAQLERIWPDSPEREAELAQLRDERTRHRAQSAHHRPGGSRGPRLVSR